MIHASAEHAVEAEMPVPKSASEVFAHALVWMLLVALVGVAIFNRTRPGATPLWSLLASVLWLLLAGAGLVGGVHAAGGLRQFLINRLGELAIQQLIWIERRPEEFPAVCFGFEIGRRRWRYLKVRLDGIAQVRWSTGQATALAGRDMADWSVAVKFDKRKSSIAPPGRRYPERLYLVGPSGPKETVAEFGLELVKFLAAAGASLVGAKDGCGFRRTRIVANDRPPDA